MRRTSRARNAASSLALELDHAHGREREQIARRLRRDTIVVGVDGNPVSIRRRSLETVDLENGMPRLRQPRDHEKPDERGKRRAQYRALERRDDERRHGMRRTSTNIERVRIYVRVPLNGVA